MCFLLFWPTNLANNYHFKSLQEYKRLIIIIIMVGNIIITHFILVFVYSISTRSRSKFCFRPLAWREMMKRVSKHFLKEKLLKWRPLLSSISQMLIIKLANWSKTLVLWIIIMSLFLLETFSYSSSGLDIECLEAASILLFREKEQTIQVYCYVNLQLRVNTNHCSFTMSWKEEDSFFSHNLQNTLERFRLLSFKFHRSCFVVVDDVVVMQHWPLKRATR